MFFCPENLIKNTTKVKLALLKSSYVLQSANIVHSVFVLFFRTTTCYMLASSSGPCSSSSMETSTFRSFGNKAGLRDASMVSKPSLERREVTEPRSASSGNKTVWLQSREKQKPWSSDLCFPMNTSPCPGSCTLISSALNPRTSNLTTNLPSSCFAFSSTHPSPSRSRTLPLFKDLVTRDVTVVGSTLS